MDLELRLGSINAKIDPADRYTDDLTAEKILREIGAQQADPDGSRAEQPGTRRRTAAYDC